MRIVIDLKRGETAQVILNQLYTHTPMQIFHSDFLVDEQGKHPPAMTLITLEDVEAGRWKVDPAVAHSVAGGHYVALQNHLLHYCRKLSDRGKYSLMIWPYHAMLGSVGHALVSAVEEAIFFHSIARHTAPRFEVKGGNPLTENYSVLSPEVTLGPDEEKVGGPNTHLVEHLLSFDAVVVAGQAASHCVQWTVKDLLTVIQARDSDRAGRIYLLRDCMSPVVVPDVVDFTDRTEEAYQEFSEAGMHLVRSTDPVESWAGLAPVG